MSVFNEYILFVLCVTCVFSFNEDGSLQQAKPLHESSDQEIPWQVRIARNTLQDSKLTHNETDVSLGLETAEVKIFRGRNSPELEEALKRPVRAAIYSRSPTSSLDVDLNGEPLPLDLTPRQEYKFYEAVKGSLKVHREPATWTDARLVCYDEGAELASPENDAMMAAMSHVLFTSRLPPLQVFTGVNDLYSKGLFTFPNGTLLSAMPTRWAAKKPNNLNTGGNCLVMEPNGSRLDAKCSDSYPYICYKRQQPTKEELSGTSDRGEPLPLALVPRQEYKFYEAVKGSLKVHQEPATWTDARLVCYDEGAELASPENDAMMAAMSHVLFTSRLPPLQVFTGVNDLYSKGLFTSPNGTLLSAMPTQWAAKKPNNLNTGGNCLVMEPNGSRLDAKCSDSYPYICYKRQQPTKEELCGTSDREYIFNKITKSCYKVHSIFLSWQEAYATCTGEGAYLAIPNSVYEAKTLAYLIKKEWTWAHIGFSYWRKDLWVTLHGETIAEAGFESWVPGEPNDWNEERCGSLSADQAQLVDIDCEDNRRPFICEKTV